MHPKIQEDMELHLHLPFDTDIDPFCNLHKATNCMLYWIGTAKTMVQKYGNTGSPCLGKRMLGQGKGGGGLFAQPVHSARCAPHYNWLTDVSSHTLEHQIAVRKQWLDGIAMLR